VDGKNRERDYCILSIFLNCGLRISEIVGLNLSDVRADHLRVLGKGNKERIVFLNDGVAGAINDYLVVRKTIAAMDRNALFLSNRRTRMSRETVHSMVKNTLLKAGLDSEKNSATSCGIRRPQLMLQIGVMYDKLRDLARAPEHHTDLYPCGQRRAAHGCPGQSLSKIKTKK
jgi:hypothetical protein